MSEAVKTDHVLFDLEDDEEYEKTSGVSGSHGEEYELNLLLDFLLKANGGTQEFRLSTGKKDVLKLDDIVLETETFNVMAQAKHRDDKKRIINKNELYAESGDYSVYVCVKAAFKKYLCDIKQQIERLESTQEIRNLLQTLSDMICNITKKEPCFNENFESLLLSLRCLKIEEVESYLSSFDRTVFLMVTNIFPHEQVVNNLCSVNLTESILSNHLNEFDQCYNFNTVAFIKEIPWNKNSQIPQTFLEMFLKKFFVVRINVNDLNANIKHLLNSACSSLEIPTDFAYNNLYKILKMWRESKRGVYIKRNLVKTYFTSIISEMIRAELKRYETFIDFDVDSLLNSKKFITQLTKKRYYLIMIMLQKKFQETLNKVLFLTSTNSEKQKLLTNAFLHKKYTHFICVLEKENEELKSLLNDLIGKIKQNDKFMKYKKIILFCEQDVDFGHDDDKNLMDDDVCFKKIELKYKSKTLSHNINNYYILRELESQDQIYKEDEFLNNILLKSEKQNFLLSNSPGMGKTTLLSRLADQINEGNRFRAVLIRLNRHTELLERHLDTKTVPQLDDFLYNDIEDTFERQIFEIPNFLILMVDGFDEISPNYSDVVIEFLKKASLKENVKAIVLSTRVNLQDRLEDVLKVKAYNLLRLSDEDACNLISRYSAQSLEIVEKWYNDVDLDVGECLKIPLFAKMVAEIFQEKCETFLSNASEINLFDLYETFIEKKKKIYVNDKCKCEGNIRSRRALDKEFQHFLNNCMRLAVKKTLSDNIERKTLADFTICRRLSIKKALPDYIKTNFYAKKYEIELDNEMDELCANGILEGSGRSLNFVHFTFQEYFYSKSVLEEIFDTSNTNDEKFDIIMKNTLLKYKHSMCIQFIEHYLKKNWGEKITDHILERFHNWVTSKSEQLGMVLSDQSLFFMSEYEKLTGLLFGRCENLSFLDIKVFRTTNTENRQKVIELIWLLIRKRANITYGAGRDMLQMAMDERNFQLVEHLVRENMVNMDDIDDEGWSWRLDMISQPPWEIEMVEFLMSIKTPLPESQFEIETYESSFIQNLLRFICSTFEELNFDSMNDLQSEAFCGNIVRVKEILSRPDCDIRQKSPEGWNVLHYAILSGNMELVKYLVHFDKRLMEQTQKQYFLFFAFQSGNPKLVEYLIELNMGQEMYHVVSQFLLKIYSKCKESFTYEVKEVFVLYSFFVICIEGDFEISRNKNIVNSFVLNYSRSLYRKVRYESKFWDFAKCRRNRFSNLEKLLRALNVPIKEK